MAKTVKEQAGRGGAWSAATRFLDQGVNALVLVVLARVLGPEAIGLLGMLMVFLYVGEPLIDSGLGRALVRDQDANAEDESSVFFFNVAMGVALGALLFFGAEQIALFFREPRVAGFARLLSLTLIFNSLSVVPVAILSKRLDFKPLFLATLPALLLAGGIAIWLAIRGAGAWSVACHFVAFSVLRTIFLWCLVRWRPGWQFSWKSLRRLLPFGLPILIAAVLSAVFGELVTIAVGRLFSPVDVGYYAQACRLQRIPCDIVAFALLQVSFPAFCLMRESGDGLKAGFEDAVQASALIGVALMAGLAAAAPSVVLVVFGEEWSPMIPFVQMLCVGGVFYPLLAANTSLLWATGRTKLHLLFICVSLVLQTVAIGLTYQDGVVAMIIGQVVVAVVSFPLLARFAGASIGVGARRQLSCGLPFILMGVGMIACVFGIGLLLKPGLLCLVLQIPTGVVVYLGLCWVFQRECLLGLINSARGVFGLAKD
jgi:O-antigen/teichoic acid export membrane protein